jgi:hypothetical protein
MSIFKIFSVDDDLWALFTYTLAARSPAGFYYVRIAFGYEGLRSASFTQDTFHLDHSLKTTDQ